LRMVASYTSLLAERYKGKLDERADKYIGYAVEGAKRMQQLISDLLDFSRVGTRAKPVEPIDTAVLFDKVTRGLRGTIADNGAEVTHGDLPTVMADETQLGMVFQNLIGNAVKFRSERPSKVRVEARQANGMWEFSVADNGIGIDKQYSGRIFQMFQRLHERGKYDGSGIGLAIVKKIIERHGGRIWFDSVPGEGTTFFFTIPAAPMNGGGYIL
jgi:light-regulated signal transduction histidine kinase (bacteriophytochrome)